MEFGERVIVSYTPKTFLFDCTESWVSPQSALLTVLTRDLYPPASELVLPPPKGGVAVDLERYYAVFLPKNLSDDYAKGANGDGGGSVNVSSIPSLLGRSASTESLHKDRFFAIESFIVLDT